jgi:hypothetical protein
MPIVSLVNSELALATLPPLAGTGIKLKQGAISCRRQTSTVKSVIIL